MNIWSLDKAFELKHLLLLLRQQLGDGFAMDLQTETTECAIYLHHPEDADMRAFVFTYGQAQAHYGVHLEFPDQGEWPRAQEAFEGVKLSGLVEILAVHFDIALIQPLP